MATKICDNPECAFHEYLPARDEHLPSVMVVLGGNREEVRRHLYADRDGSNRRYFCHVCHSAISMVVGNQRGK